MNAHGDFTGVEDTGVGEVRFCLHSRLRRARHGNIGRDCGGASGRGRRTSAICDQLTSCQRLS